MCRYVSAEKRDYDDFTVKFTREPGEIVWDAMTVYGSWATMTEKSFDIHAHPYVQKHGPGVGMGQKYVRQENGELQKVEQETVS